ncbi:DUF4406 domain-containing protein [Pseudomonas aeruginosa]|uniref:DUF4406 domain-containing protein n=1 Tax=Pseudomonas aeruginosa TaxID=287 RepID=UPI001F27843E|nr:DUF4406 domain-containing protein [Pseudomonas aeruginosa]
MSMELNKESVEQAGGDERTAFEAWATHLPMDRQYLRPDLYMPTTQLAWEAWQARAALAQPSPAAVQLSGSRERRIYVAGPMTGYKDFNFPAFNAQAEALRGLGYHVENPAEHGIVEGAEWQDYLRYDIGRLSTCEAIFLLPGWSKSKGAALEVHIAKALGMTFIHHADAEREQPSPAQAEQAERPEVVARVVHPNPVVLDQCGPLNANDELMTVSQHAASVAHWAEMFNRVEQERDAALARVAELEKQEPVATVAKVPGEDWNSLDFHRELQDMHPGTKLYAAPVAQAQPEETPGEILAAKLIETWVAKHGKPAPWSKIVEITALATNMPNDERDRLLALDDDVGAQAQYSVPEEFIGRLSEFLAQRGATGKALLRELRAMLAAAPAQGGE